MAHETVKEAKKIYNQYIVSGGMINIDKMLEWHRNCRGDRGERSWWTTTALLEIFRVLAQHSDKSYYKSEVEKWLPEHDEIIGSGPVTLQKANGAAWVGGDYCGVYVQARMRPNQSRLVWHGPLQTPNQTLSEWPTALWEYRTKVDFGYLGGPLEVVAWFPINMVTVGSTLMHSRNFYPTTDLSISPEKDRMQIQDMVWNNIPNNL